MIRENDYHFTVFIKFTYFGQLKNSLHSSSRCISYKHTLF